MDISLPSRAALKAQAKRLRASLSASGHHINHALALETVAQQWGFRDWNTASAKAGRAPKPVWYSGQRVTGRYLGQRFAGTLKAAIPRSGAFWTLDIRFDTPVDVVTSTLFSGLRQQVNCTVNATGCTVEKTSDGQPHLVLDSHWTAPQ